MNRKGSLTDVIALMVVFMALVIMGFLTLYLNTKFSTALIATAHPDANATAILNNGTVAAGIWVSSIPIIIMGLALGSIVSAFFIPSHPVFLPVSIILLSIYTILATVFANVLWEFINIAEIATIANGYPLIVSMIVKLPYIVTVIGIIIIIVMFGKSGE